MAKTNTTNNTDTTGTTPQAPAQEETLVLVRVTKTGTLINGAYGRAGATARVTASQARSLEAAGLAVRIGV